MAAPLELNKLQEFDRKLETNFQRKLEEVTAGLPPEYSNLLLDKIPRQDTITVIDYIMSLKAEVNASENYRKDVIKCMTRFIAFCYSHSQTKAKKLKQLQREDVLAFLDGLRKPEASDPLHRWIGTYNIFRIHLLRFFKWLYYPDVLANKRPKPSVVENIPQLKRKEKSIYKPTDLWTSEDDLLFLKYCPSKRMKCFHIMAKDTSCRPHELLKLRVRDVNFKVTTDKYQYAELLVNGKTGSRPLVLIDSIPYLKDYLDHEHPQPSNPNAILLSGNRKSFGRAIGITAIEFLYRYYKKKLFPKLLESPNVLPEDKPRIKELLKKPWNPYILRHSSLTEKSKILKEHILRQHAGWSTGSQMPQKYLHYFGNESNESLLVAYGIVPKGLQIDQLKPKQCPNCSEPNKPDSKFCAKCRMVLTYDAYSETLEKQQEKDSEVQILKQKYEQDINAMREEMNQQLNQIMSMIQQNNQLAYIKPEALTSKTIQQ
jgi:integrase